MMLPIDLSRIPRTTNRATWKAVWRQRRIVNREIGKAMTDAALFGTGFYRHGESVPDHIAHVSPHNVFRQERDNP
jgi:hypothetical protein